MGRVVKYVGVFGFNEVFVFFINAKYEKFIRENQSSGFPSPPGISPKHCTRFTEGVNFDSNKIQVYIVPIC